MYGMVNKAVEGLVRNQFGDEAWLRIKERAGVTEEVFLSNEGYPDHITYDLVAAASAELNLPPETILHAFGEYWILETARRGYGTLLDTTGSTLPEFLQNLPQFHSRVRLIFPNLLPPRFETSDVTDHSLILHYHSDRPGLAPFLIGLLHGLGKRLKTEVAVEQTVRKGEADATHDQFLVTWKNAGAT